MLSRVLQLVCCGLILASCQSAPEPVPFEQHFKKVRTVALSGEVLINGRVRSLDVNQRGDLLVTDIGHVYLFDREGALKNTLDPSPCHPGFRMRPISAHFRPDGKILMFNSGGGAFAFLFRQDGSCWKAARDDIFHPASFTFASREEIYGHYMRPDADTNQIKRLTGEGKLLESFDVPASEYNNVDFRMGGRGAMVSTRNRIYHTLPSTSAIHVYNTEGRRTDVIDNSPAYYRPVTTHIPGRLENPMASFPEHMRPVRRESTLNTSLFLLDEDKLLLQYSLDEGNVGIDVLDLEGDRLIHGPITVDVTRTIKLAQLGKAYQAVQPDASEDGRIPNPRIEVYRFKQ